MKTEQKLAAFVAGTQYEDIPLREREIVIRQMTALFGALIAGNASGGCLETAQLAREVGGREEATILVHGGKVPAQQAAFVNSVMGRALDICDHIAPGVHIGSSVIPAALAAAELAGGCSGRDLICAIAVGTETALRLNLEDLDFDGFDPTGVCSVFASAAAAAKLLRLNELQTHHTLALAFNRCGGSFQSNIDGSLAVRVIEGWTAQMGVECARLAQRGITGPDHYLEGVYGYYHLFGRDRHSPEQAVAEPGAWHLSGLNFKKYPSCGQTQGATQVICDLMREEGLHAGNVDHVEIRMPPFAHKLVGKPFEIGPNPKVDAQFNVRYCVANALVRSPVRLEHFEPEYIRDPAVLTFLERVVAVADPVLEETRGHYSNDLIVTASDGRVFRRSVDVPPGTPGNPLSEEEHRQRFFDCVAFQDKRWLDGRAGEIYRLLTHLEEEKTLDGLIALFQPEK